MTTRQAGGDHERTMQSATTVTPSQLPSLLLATQLAPEDLIGVPLPLC